MGKAAGKSPSKKKGVPRNFIVRLLPMYVTKQGCVYGLSTKRASAARFPSEAAALECVKKALPSTLETEFVIEEVYEPTAI